MTGETKCTHGAACTCDDCMAKDERQWTYWHEQTTTGVSATVVPVATAATSPYEPSRTTISAERWAEIARVAAFGTPVDTLPSASALARMVEDLVDEVRRLRSAHADEPRDIIRHFAAAMEAKLAANDAHKDGWRASKHRADEMRWKALQHVRALREEVAELEYAVIDFDSLRIDANAEQVRNVLMEAADCALYALMVADVVGALPPTNERGR